MIPSRQQHISLTRHFCANWIERVGTVPNPAEVQRIVNESIEVQRGRNILLQNGGTYNLLSIFWQPDRDVIILIDHRSNRAVSCLSRRNFSKRRQPRQPVNGNRRHAL